ncbi:MAG: ATP-dependent DNA ligase, partial [Bacteroidetes bacterium]
MNRFLALYRALDQTTSQQARLAVLTQYFREEDPHEAAWVVYLLRGGHLRRFVSPRRLREWIAAFLDLPLSLIEAAYQQVGDLAETLALLLPNRERPFSGALPPLALLAEKILPHIATLPESAQQAWLAQQWEQLSFWEAYLLHKLLLGGFRVGVAEGLLIAALAEALELPPAQVAARLSGALNHPSPSFYEQLRTPHTDSPEPYPFFLAYPIEELGNDFQEKLGSPTAYQIEWKWDGVRVQLVRRSGKVALWSRGGVPLTEGFPDVVIPHQSLPDGTVLDGELVILRENQVQPFAAIQRRLLRKKVT